jgi:hypothetical protein
LRLAMTFDPINPAPPVTSNIDIADRLKDRSAPTDRHPTFARERPGGQLGRFHRWLM